MRRLICLSTLVLAVACGDGPTTPSSAFDGTYDLVFANGSSLPATVTTPLTGPATVTAGVLVLSKGDADVQIGLILGQGVSAFSTIYALSGTYTTGHDTVYVRDASDGSVYPATVSGNRLTATIEGVALAFDRRP